MRILVVNVNTTASMTDSIVAAARSAAAPGTEIVGLTPTFGADSCEGNVESYLAAVGVLDVVQRYREPFDAVIQAGFGEHGREGLQEYLDVPVVDITEAAAIMAGLLGHKFGIVTTLDRTVPLIEDRLLLAGLDRRCAAVVASGLGVLELEEDPDRAVAAIVARAAEIVRDRGVEVICLGCGGMAGLDEKVREATGTPVVDGVAAAVKLAEGLVALGLSTSKVRTYAPARPKRLTGWPLPA
ncbi:MAG: aspartate/glutamate racemase family protein [Austwickia sp.]|nr:Asp/Glu/hydantoin racemase [Tetrasphaera sp.]MCO5308986.1 aspartate/glutamate racemase family protein [Austwickia sp.]